MQLRTQIYLEPDQHAALLKEARRWGLSLAGMIRKLVDDHILHEHSGTDLEEEERIKAALSIVGLGKSGLTDVSENVDRYLGEAIYEDLMREKAPRYKSSKRRRRKREHPR